MNNLSTLLVVALASVAMAFTPVPSTHQRLQQQISSTDGSSSSPSCVILDMGSRGATKWEKKKEWLRSRGMSDEDLDESTSTGNPMTPVNIIIAGAPASGKGTQCEIIKEEFGVVHLSTGDMLRAAVTAGTDVGVKAKEFMG